MPVGVSGTRLIATTTMATPASANVRALTVSAAALSVSTAAATTTDLRHARQSRFRVYTARDDQETVTVIHEWADEAAFATYLLSDAFARLGAVLRPMTASALSRRFRADLLETV